MHFFSKLSYVAYAAMQLERNVLILRGVGSNCVHCGLPKLLTLTTKLNHILPCLKRLSERFLSVNGVDEFRKLISVSIKDNYLIFYVNTV